jgi:hypothetical protein
MTAERGSAKIDKRVGSIDRRRHSCGDGIGPSGELPAKSHLTIVQRAGIALAHQRRSTPTVIHDHTPRDARSLSRP